MTLFELASKKALVDRPLVRSGSDTERLELPGGLYEVRLRSLAARSPLCSVGMIKRQVKRSLLANAGRGLFALRPIKKGARLGTYSGARLTRREAARSASAYLMDLSKSVVIDGADLSNQMRWVNDAGSEEAANARACVMRYGKADAYIGFYAKRNIELGEEIYIYYGSDYWEDKEEIV